MAVVLVLTGLTLSSRAQRAERVAFARESAVTNPASFLESKAERDQRMKWWRAARFGMFIHWGLYAVPAGEYKGQRSTRIGEWIMEWANIPRADYEKFRPIQSSEAQCRRLGGPREGGRHEIHRHHVKAPRRFFHVAKGRSVNNITSIDALSSRSDRSVGANEETGLKIFYYSILDWHYPSHVDAPGKGSHRREIARPKCGRVVGHVKYRKAQLRELITKYDPAVLWFDGEWQDCGLEETARPLQIRSV